MMAPRIAYEVIGRQNNHQVGDKIKILHVDELCRVDTFSQVYMGKNKHKEKGGHPRYDIAINFFFLRFFYRVNEHKHHNERDKNRDEISHKCCD